MEESTNGKQIEKGIELLPEGVKQLDEARKWSLFLSILGFIGIGFMLIAALLMSIIFNFIPDKDFPGGFGLILALVYLVLGGLYFFPVLYLFQFSQKSKQAVKDHNSSFLVEAFGKLKSHYKFIGIMSIVMMVLYPVIMILLVVVGVFSNL